MARVDPAQVHDLGSGYAQGVALVLVSGVIFSLGGILIRSMDAATGWQILFYRSAAGLPVILIAIAVKHRGSVVPTFRAAGWTAVVGGIGVGTAMACFVFAVLHTTVANVLFVMSATPIVAALLGWLVLRERVGGRTLAAGIVTITGVGVMTFDALGESRLFGSLISLVMISGFAVFVVALRRGKGVDMLPAVCVAGVFVLVLAGLMADDLGVSAHDFLLAFLLGAGQVGIGLIIFIRGSVHVPAAELALLSLIEVVLGPIWVWWGVGEVPSALTLAGGAIVLAAVAYQAAGVRSYGAPLGAP